MIIITGGVGFIGSVLLWKLNRLDRKDILLVDQGAQGSAKWPNVAKHSFDACIESSDFIARLEKGEFSGKVDAVFHMGACSSTTEMDTAYLRENNSLYSERIARWCLDQKVYLSYASSAALTAPESRVSPTRMRSRPNSSRSILTDNPNWISTSGS